MLPCLHTIRSDEALGGDAANMCGLLTDIYATYRAAEPAGLRVAADPRASSPTEAPAARRDPIW